jgi:arsenite methyltransferase
MTFLAEEEGEEGENTFPPTTTAAARESEIRRRAVRERYSKLARSKRSISGREKDLPSSIMCEDGDCCSQSLITIGVTVPTEALEISAGCGSPLDLVSLKEGDIVVDLGSGGGIDVFRASRFVGKSGRAIGVDSTPEMISRARETAERYRDDYANVEFRLGEIERLPIESESVDYVISNCVINLSPDKPSVFGEAFRVLKPGGVFAVADITLEKEIPTTARTNDMDSWSACIAGALADSEYEKLLHEAGFKEVQIQHVSPSNIGVYPFPYFSSHIKAIKK